MIWYQLLQMKIYRCRLLRSVEICCCVVLCFLKCFHSIYFRFGANARYSRTHIYWAQPTELLQFYLRGSLHVN